METKVAKRLEGFTGYIPCGTWVILELPNEVTESGLIIPATVTRNLDDKMLVAATGPDCKHIEPGMYVLGIGEVKYLKINGKEYVQTWESGIIGIVEPGASVTTKYIEEKEADKW